MKRNVLMIVLSLLVGVFLFSPVSANASLITEGEPFDIGSWSQGFRESGVGYFDEIEAIMISADDDFKSPGFRSFTVSGWAGTFLSGDHILAAGTRTTDMTFNIDFNDDKSDPLVFDFLAWDGDILREAARATWSGSGWSFTESPEDYTKPVPEPATMLLLGFGLVGLATAGRRKFFRK